jgi:tRNA U38,U39,U40 pseudouridine synthase TruA
MQIQYEGEVYYGFTSQTGGCEETVEKYIFEALLKLRLIEDRHVRENMYILYICTYMYHYCNYTY